MPTKKKATPPVDTTPRKSRPEDEESGDSLYYQAKNRYGADYEGFYAYLRDHRLDDSTMCLGYYLERAKRERNLNQTDIAERTRTSTEPPITRSFLSALLGGRSGVRAETWVRIADALDANPLEFFVANGWIDPAHISAFQVPHSHLLVNLAQLLDQIEPEFRPGFVSVAEASAQAIIGQQNAMKRAQEAKTA